MRGHADECPCSHAVCQPPCTTCTCGGGLPIVAPTPQVLEHTAHCPVRAMAAGDEACTCGAGVPVVAPIDVSHTGLCPAAMGGSGPCTCERTPPPAADAPKGTDDNPYRDVEYARTLIKRAESLATESPDLARFLLEIATEARLLAELQGKWEY